MSPIGTALATVAVVMLIGWRIYRRMRRLIGRQRSKLPRHVIAVVLLPIVLALLGFSAWLANRDALMALGGGVLAGVALGVVGLRLTRFEKTEEGWFYTPNAHIGIALSALLVGRLAYRFIVVGPLLAAPARDASQSLARSPLTLLIVGTLLAYYAAYSAGLLRWRLRN
jgi:heme A synthase